MCIFCKLLFKKGQLDKSIHREIPDANKTDSMYSIYQRTLSNTIKKKNPVSDSQLQS